MNTKRVLLQPTVRIEIDAQPVEIVVFPLDGIRQAPVSPVDGKPMRRAAIDELRQLLDAPA